MEILTALQSLTEFCSDPIPAGHSLLTVWSDQGNGGGGVGGRVPEAGYWICGARRGIVPATLAPLLEKRRRYKRLKVEKLKVERGEARSGQEEGLRSSEAGCPMPALSGGLPAESGAPPAELAEIYEARQKAIKWILVTCFGYLGYRNARFGRIEAHEAVTAFGREKLLQAKEIAEARGWRVLHGLTDCLYLAEKSESGMRNPEPETGNAKYAVRNEEYEISPIPRFSHSPFHRFTVPPAPSHESPACLTPSAPHLTELCEEITRATGVEMAIEGVYRWVCFLPSRLRPNVSVPNRFWGVFTDGKVKVRGLLLRKHDTPEVIREAQRKALEYLAQFETLEEARAHRADVEALFEGYAEQIRSGHLSLEALAFKRRLTRALEDYRAKTPVSVSLWKLRNAGIRLEAGQFLRYLIVDAKAPTPEERYLPLELCADDTPYDVEKYLELLKEARAEILFYAPEPSRAQASPRIRFSTPPALPFRTEGGGSP